MCSLQQVDHPEEKAYLHAFGSMYSTLIEQIDSTIDLSVFWIVRLPSSQSLVSYFETAAIDELVAAVKKVYGYDVLYPGRH